MYIFILSFFQLFARMGAICSYFAAILKCSKPSEEEELTEVIVEGGVVSETTPMIEKTEGTIRTRKESEEQWYKWLGEHIREDEPPPPSRCLKCVYWSCCRCSSHRCLRWLGSILVDKQVSRPKDVPCLLFRSPASLSPCPVPPALRCSVHT